MAIYTRRFAAGFKAGVGYEHIYAVPDDGVYVLRDVAMVNNHASLAAALGILTYTPGGGYLWLARYPSVPIGDSVHWMGRQVLDNDEDLVLYTSAGALHYYATGYALGV